MYSATATNPTLGMAKYHRVDLGRYAPLDTVNSNGLSPTMGQYGPLDTDPQSGWDPSIVESYAPATPEYAEGHMSDSYFWLPAGETPTHPKPPNVNLIALGVVAAIGLAALAGNNR